MYHLRRHRTMYYLYFADKQLSEGMWKQQAEKEIALQIEMLYASSI